MRDFEKAIVRMNSETLPQFATIIPIFAQRRTAMRQMQSGAVISLKNVIQIREEVASEK